MAKQTINYQNLSQQLDAIVSELEAGNLSIDEAIKKYKQGTEIVAKLQDYLKQAENTIKKLRADKS